MKKAYRNTHLTFKHYVHVEPLAIGSVKNVCLAHLGALRSDADGTSRKGSRYNIHLEPPAIA